MYDRFGEFDSAEELNKKAEELKEAGSIDEVYRLALENGIDKEDAEDYLNGYTDGLATPLMAALGRLEVESRDLKLDGVLKDWKYAVAVLCTEDALLCAAVRKKDRSLKDCMAAVVKYSFENRVRVDDRIVKAVKVRHNGKLGPMRAPLYLGIPDRTQTKQIIRDYYVGGGHDCI